MAGVITVPITLFVVYVPLAIGLRSYDKALAHRLLGPSRYEADLYARWQPTPEYRLVLRSGLAVSLAAGVGVGWWQWRRSRDNMR